MYVLRTFEVQSLSSFQVCNALLTNYSHHVVQQISKKLHIRTEILNHLANIFPVLLSPSHPWHHHSTLLIFGIWIQVDFYFICLHCTGACHLSCIVALVKVSNLPLIVGQRPNRVLFLIIKELKAKEVACGLWDTSIARTDVCVFHPLLLLGLHFMVSFLIDFFK